MLQLVKSAEVDIQHCGISDRKSILLNHHVSFCMVFKQMEQDELLWRIS